MAGKGHPNSLKTITDPVELPPRQGTGTGPERGDDSLENHAGPSPAPLVCRYRDAHLAKNASDASSSSSLVSA